jgi:hypothetical protein
MCIKMLDVNNLVYTFDINRSLTLNPKPMPTKKLSPKEIDKMKRMVVQGVYPGDIAERFHMAVSSVHNYKKRFREEGLKYPSLRGKHSTFYQSLENTGKPEQRDESQLELNLPTTIHAVNPENYLFVIDHVEVEVSKEAKHVNIDKDKMEVTF